MSDVLPRASVAAVSSSGGGEVVGNSLVDAAS